MKHLTLIALSVLVGCTTTKPTGVVLQVTTDLEVPSEIDQMAIRVEGQDKAALDETYSLGKEAVTLPGTLTVTGEPGATVLITVAGRHGDKLVVSTRARVTLQEGELLWVHLALLRGCVGIKCGEGQSCSAHGCSDIDINAPGPKPSDGGPDDAPELDAADARPDIPDAGCVHPDVSIACSDGWCQIPAGCFMMGSPDDELCREKREVQRQVTLTHDFEIMRFEVTQEQFKNQFGYIPNTSDYEPTFPVDSATWHEAVAYCNALSEAAGLSACYKCTGTNHALRCETEPQWNEPWWKSSVTFYDCPGYRLPTEAEWEYAYRAGTTGPYYLDGKICNDPTEVCEVGWFSFCTSSLHQVGQKKPNSWGLYDMAGNVAEWVHDIYEKNPSSDPVTDPLGQRLADLETRVIRGGAYGNTAGYLRAAYRGYDTPTTPRTGFRCARTLP